MHVSTAIKWLHRVVTLLLIILVGGYLAYRYSMNSPPDDSLWLKKSLSQDTTLYITRYNGGGATVSDVYRYYLADDTQTLQQLGESQPFLISDTGNASVSGHDDSINVVLTGRVYSFSNSMVFYREGKAVMPLITFHATGVP
ncbi:hypothetical protein M1D83_02690 [Enterobacteriaceae bacterium]